MIKGAIVSLKQVQEGIKAFDVTKNSIQNKIRENESVQEFKAYIESFGYDLEKLQVVLESVMIAKPALKLFLLAIPEGKIPQAVDLISNVVELLLFVLETLNEKKKETIKSETI